ncbi:plasmid pRiA4b ORF-3 family protein [Sporosarcina koreensis]|uniref:plasmid pRiA4b ORF-3 family protein n=1 Tax=Sporosarcina koreensis TaxID=334735 RepID=UPI0006942063|nr:plasmid pRiA4b ORF-3 family protein [Sporosarcina koreensis]
MKSYILKFTMLDMHEPVWRRVVMPAGATFNRLHSTIQHVTNFRSYYTDSPYHFFEIEVDGLCITDNPVRREELKGSKKLKPKQPTRLKIDTYIEDFKELIYEYDLGDGWRFKIELEDIVDDYHFGFPTLLDAEGEAPPEDVGGPPGFEAFLKTIRNPADPEHDHMLAWARSNGWRLYDKQHINRMLKTIKYGKTDWDKIDHDNHTILSDPYRDSEAEDTAAPQTVPGTARDSNPAQPAALSEDEHEIEQYIRAMVNLYGFAEAEHVASLYSEQNGKTLSADDLLALVASSGIESSLKEDVIFVRNGHFLGPKLVHIDPDQFFKEIYGKPYFEPPKEQLLRYADSGYIEHTPEIEELERLFLEQHIPQMQIDRMLHAYMKDLSVWHANFMQAAVRLMEAAGPLSEESINRIMPAAIRVSNTVRMIENRGYTPQELHELAPGSVQPAAADGEPAKKPGRNDPCTCGSGKKYKKCCGK